MVPIFFLNKLNRLLLTYLYTDDSTSPALISVSILSCIFLLALIQLLHRNKSKKLKVSVFSGINYAIVLLLTFMTQSLLGMMLMASISIFMYVYMQVLTSYLISICVGSDGRLIRYLYPCIYTYQVVGCIMKIVIVDSNSNTFQSLTTILLIIQGLGFLFISGVDIRKLRQLCTDYVAHHDAEAKLKAGGGGNSNRRSN